MDNESQGQGRRMNLLRSIRKGDVNKCELTIRALPIRR